MTILYLTGIEITNVDNPPPGSEVEKRRRKRLRKLKQPFASPNSDLVMNGFSSPAAKDDEPSSSSSDDNIVVASASTLPAKPESTNKKPATQPTEASTTAQKRPRRGKVIRWYPDEDD